MTKMKIAPGDQKRVKLQCLRLLLTLQLDPAKSDLIFLFMETYLRLSTTDEQWYQQQVATMPTTEKEQTMELISSYRREGRREGRQEGVTALVSSLLQRKFGSVPDTLQQRVQSLTSANAEALAAELLGNITLVDVEVWLNRLS